MSGTIPLPLFTDRLVLRDFMADDWQAVLAYASDPEVVRHEYWGPWNETEVRAYIDEMLAVHREEPRSAWEVAVVRAADGRLIGACDVTLEGDRAGDIGYTFVRDAWGQGYATEAAGALMHAAFTHLDLHRVFALVSPENGASIRVLEKLGLQREGLTRGVRHAKGRWWDMWLYAVLASDPKPPPPRPPTVRKVRLTFPPARSPER